MIDTKRTMGSLDYERPRASTANFTEEGMLVVRSFNTTTGVEEATHGTAAGGLTLLGFSKLDTVSPSTTEVVAEEGLEVPATADSDGDYHVTLGHDALTSDFETNGDVAVYDVTNETWLAVEAAIGDGDFIVSDAANGELEFHSAQAGIEINVYYRRTLTASQRDQKYQRRHINSGAQDDLEKVGIIGGEGEIYTDQYDVSVGDWSTGTLRTGANGCITTQAGGTDISAYVRVIAIPTVDRPTLGLAFNL